MRPCLGKDDGSRVKRRDLAEGPSVPTLTNRDSVGQQHARFASFFDQRYQGPVVALSGGDEAAHPHLSVRVAEDNSDLVRRGVAQMADGAGGAAPKAGGASIQVVRVSGEALNLR